MPSLAVAAGYRQQVVHVSLRHFPFLLATALFCQSVATAADFDLVPSPATRAAPQSQFDQRHIALPRRDDRRQVEFLPPVAMWTYRMHRVNAGIILGSWQIAHQRRSPGLPMNGPAHTYDPP